MTQVDIRAPELLFRIFTNAIDGMPMRHGMWTEGDGTVVMKVGVRHMLHSEYFSHEKDVEPSAQAVLLGSAEQICQPWEYKRNRRLENDRRGDENSLWLRDHRLKTSFACVLVTRAWSASADSRGMLDPLGDGLRRNTEVHRGCSLSQATYDDAPRHGLSTFGVRAASLWAPIGPPAVD
ncbi:hypothetical protein [Bradyrhizobium yuanmingense]|uniref:hypothetical protein n=1 Tax=Bradyrhizobium yuanmingense TaxID=108015 RepID=UPI0023B8A340|nr:hypothetical protein [Bradyrhizobium yuanmingense]MDF0582188.1 hypothetical protein [Bradyrhizobium yuanmingense]